MFLTFMTFLNLNDLNDDTTLKIVDVFNVDSYYHAFKVNLFKSFFFCNFVIFFLTKMKILSVRVAIIALVK